MKYQIYHDENPETRFDYEEDTYHLKKLTKVGEVDATSLDTAYIKSQNFDNNWNPENPCRSTSVGDAIVCPDNKVNIVMGVGFINQGELYPEDFFK
jgi:hypothetical protein